MVVTSDASGNFIDIIIESAMSLSSRVKAFWWPALVVTLALLYLPKVKSTDSVVKIPQGELRGSVQVSRNGRTYNEFLGVPFGKVEKRFGLSEPAEGWNGVRDATKRGPWCMQANSLMNKLVGEEDCLVLNLYTPKIPTSSENFEGYPVLVWIHGGAFFLGSANEYGGNLFMNENVVLVTLNYRLGAFGFLNAGVEGASGNQGIKDLVLGLKWVQENIKYFGGDPNKVVIFGESAGGGAVSLLTLAPMAKGLFHGAISESGVALSPFTDRKEDPLKEAKKLAVALDCPTSDSSFMVECLRRVSAAELTKATISVHPSHWFFDVVSTPQFAPSVETYMTSPEETILPKAPLKILQEGTFNRVPWISGFTTNEGILIMSAMTLLNDTLRELINSEWGRVAPNTFLYHAEARDPCKVSSKVRAFYFGEDPEISLKNNQSLVNLYGDRFFTQPAREALLLYSQFAPAYGYNFTRKVKESTAQMMGWPDSSEMKTPTHGDELQYVFDFPEVPYTSGIKKGHPEEAFSDNMISLFVSFARDGKPSQWGQENLDWPTVTLQNDQMSWMTINDEMPTLVPEDNAMTSRMHFWNDILNEMRSDPKK